jgi:hypothetical protein
VRALAEMSEANPAARIEEDELDAAFGNHNPKT